MTELPWVVIRRDDDSGNHYRVGRYATREEAQGVADGLAARGRRQVYLVQRVDAPV